MFLYQIFRPFAYLVIKDQSKWKIDWLLPILLGAVSVILYVTLPHRPQIFMDKGLLDKLSAVLAILPGFYIAALAAIATFNKNDMDEYMPEPTPIVKIRHRGVNVPIQLTRRRMLSMQFGYLSLISLLLFIITASSNTIAENVKIIFPQNWHPFISAVYVFIFSLLFWHMIIVTFFGLYQLSDRMHQPDQH